MCFGIISRISLYRRYLNIKSQNVSFWWRQFSALIETIRVNVVECVLVYDNHLRKSPQSLSFGIKTRKPENKKNGNKIKRTFGWFTKTLRSVSERYLFKCAAEIETWLSSTEMTVEKKRRYDSNGHCIDFDIVDKTKNTKK